MILLQLNSDHTRISTMYRMSMNSDIKAFRKFIQDEVDRLRVESDGIMDRDAELLSKGARQCLVRILELTDREVIKSIKSRVEAQDNSN